MAWFSLGISLGAVGNPIPEHADAAGSASARMSSWTGTTRLSDRPPAASTWSLLDKTTFPKCNACSRLPFTEQLPVGTSNGGIPSQSKWLNARCFVARRMSQSNRAQCLERLPCLGRTHCSGESDRLMLATCIGFAPVQMPLRDSESRCSPGRTEQPPTDVDWLRLDTPASNVRLRAYYESLGFRLQDELDVVLSGVDGKAEIWRAALYERKTQADR
jgi:hypothetical protein